MGNTLIFQFLCINVLNYRYFYTDCSTFLNVKKCVFIENKNVYKRVIYYNYMYAVPLTRLICLTSSRCIKHSLVMHTASLHQPLCKNQHTTQMHAITQQGRIYAPKISPSKLVMG